MAARSAFGLSDVAGWAVGPARSKSSAATLAHNRGAGAGKAREGRGGLANRRSRGVSIAAGARLSGSYLRGPGGRRFGAERPLSANGECQPHFHCQFRQDLARAGIDRGARDSGGQTGYGVLPAKWTVSFPFTTSGVMAHVPRHDVSATFSAAFSPAKM
jgi:hypothetical protein